MALRSRSRTAALTSGPGRGPRSDGRSRHRRPPADRGRVRHRHADSADELQRRAEVLFAERAGERRDSGKGPPAGEWAGDGTVVGDGSEQLEGDGQEPLTGEHRSGVRRGSDSEGGEWRERAGPALRERMPVWLQARCGLERRNVVALSVLLVVAAVFALQHFWTGRTQSVQAPQVVRAAAPFGESGQTGDGASGQTGDGGRREAGGPVDSGGGPVAAGSAGAEIVVDVSGKVREPGIQRLPAGARVADALKAAGGVRPGTNTDTLNRARFLVDGEQVVVGGQAAPAPAPVTGMGGPVAGGAAGTAAAPVSLNTATVDQLDTLPGVGPVLAQHIVDYRTRHGGFRSVNELREVNGIGDRRFADLRNLVRP
ncbi:MULTISPECIES: ComEA family DNA-binding protein [unclassified Streptomyces]|uniref:ComEA family DNA-binding protein n=1 Tax=unclassified Streptomyces TaxID=2593676 RepID=UPI0024738111|nr:ComEA family DNA-binding protein [Streptomyces sp. SAI-133]